MRSVRTREKDVLGYPIERVDDFDASGLLRSARYEVLCPLTHGVLATCTTLRAAQRFVLLHELSAVRSELAIRRRGSRVA
jgi:hypothetical protein